MKKIISLFKRNYEGDRLVYNEVVPGAEWVLEGLGVATRKFDGTSCMIRGGKLYRRYDAKQGKTPPPGFEPAQEPDLLTGHWPGWIHVRDDKADIWHNEAALNLNAVTSLTFGEGTYELVGPKINGNNDGFHGHTLIPHGMFTLEGVPLDFEGIRSWLSANPMEGIVWHRNTGEMVKIKRGDFGLPWPVK